MWLNISIYLYWICISGVLSSNTILWYARRRHFLLCWSHCMQFNLGGVVIQSVKLQFLIVQKPGSTNFRKVVDPVSIADKMSFCKISRSLEAERLSSIIIASLWNFTGVSAALLPVCLSRFSAIGQFQTPISRLRDFVRNGDNPSYLISKRDTGINKTSLLI